MRALDAQEIFVRHFLPLYPADAFEDLQKVRSEDVNPAKNPAIFAHLEEAAKIFVVRAKSLFGEDLGLDFTDASIHRLSAALTRTRRDAWAAAGEAGTAGNELFNVIVHGAAYTGECAKRNRKAEWSARRPLWESIVILESKIGTAKLAIFHWWLKSLADEAFDSPQAATLADRYRTHVEAPTFDADALPAFLSTTAERKMPRITKPTYDVFYKYLKAHLSEIKDVGVDFPSAERFAGYDFRWLDFLILGGGRLLLIAGANEAGVHLFWLGKSGFEKGAFIPCESFPDPIVKADAEKVVVVARAVIGEGPSAQKKDIVHEMPWWGS
ncbi:MAG: hypothetical protein ABI551_05210 [Polyangiaceae bacterium]